MQRTIHASLAVVLVFVLASASQAIPVQTVIFSETFNTNTTDLANTVATYPAFSGLAGTGSINVASNRLQIVRGAGAADNYFLTNQTFNQEIWVNVDMGGTAGGPGSYAAGLAIGNRLFEFFPGCCGGALRIYPFNPATGAIGTQLSSPGDIVMPFTPAVNVMHHITIHSNNAGIWDLTFTDGANPSNVYNQTFNFPGFVPGPVGFSSIHNPATTVYDNLTISALVEVPEPSTLALLGIGVVGLVVKRRHRRG